MCKIYNSVGCLTTIKSHLLQNNISDFNSLDEIIKFQKDYFEYQEKIMTHHEFLINKEKERLSFDIPLLKNSLQIERNNIEEKLLQESNNLKQKLDYHVTFKPSNFFQKINQIFQKFYLTKKVRNKEKNFSLTIENSMRDFTVIYTNKKNRFNYIQSNFRDAVKTSCSDSIKELERKKRTVDEINKHIYGAIGELKVENELRKLDDNYFLINDFCFSFEKPIYHHSENDYIKSVQIDHLLISPAGIFIIETKNWSEKSLSSLSLRSPVKQIKRAGFALYKLLANENTEKGSLKLQHHWGNIKIPIKDLIVFTKSKPVQQFDHVKILTLNNLIGYVEYFKPAFSNKEVQKIANYLLSINKPEM